VPPGHVAGQLYFFFYITPELAERIGRETNRYAQQVLENAPKLKIIL
jgi:hypothetical protein